MRRKSETFWRGRRDPAKYDFYFLPKTALSQTHRSRLMRPASDVKGASKEILEKGPARVGKRKWLQKNQPKEAAIALYELHRHGCDGQLGSNMGTEETTQKVQ